MQLVFKARKELFSNQIAFVIFDETQLSTNPSFILLRYDKTLEFIACLPTYSDEQCGKVILLSVIVSKEQKTGYLGKSLLEKIV